MTTSQSRKCLVGLLAVSFAFLGTAHANEPTAACKQEVQRVAVWPKGGNPKSAQVARVETREVTVCNGKVVSSKPERNASTR